MRWQGIPPSTLLVWGLACALALLALYLLREPRRTIVVPFFVLWERAARKSSRSRVSAWLKRLASFLIHALLVALLLLALGEPESKTVARSQRHWMVLVDVSASMQSVDVRPSRLAEAKRHLLDFVAAVPETDRVLLVAVDDSFTPLTPWTSDSEKLKRTIVDLKSHDLGADWGQALDRAHQVLRGLLGPQMVLVTDSEPDTLAARVKQGEFKGVGLSAFRVGEQGKNLGITAFAARRRLRQRHQSDATVEVTSFVDEEASVELSLTSSKRVLDVVTLHLQPKERRSLSFLGISGISRVLEAELRGGSASTDCLEVDDRAWAVVPEQRPTRIVVVGSGNTYLEAALLTDPLIEPTFISPKAAWPEGDWDGAIFDAVDPRPEWLGPMLLLGVSPGNQSVRADHKLRGFGFDRWEREDELLRNLALEDVQIETGYSLRLNAGDQILGASVNGPILIRGRRDDRSVVALGFDPKQSDLVLRPAWPLFVLNVVHSFLTQDARFVSSFATGQAISLPVPQQASEVTLLAPDHESTSFLARDGVAEVVFGRVGVHQLSAATKPRFTMPVGVNLFDESESNLLPIAATDQIARLPRPQMTVSKRQTPYWYWCVLVAAMLTALEWLSFHRRWTV